MTVKDKSEDAVLMVADGVGASSTLERPKLFRGKKGNVRLVHAPYKKVGMADYQNEKRRLQYEILKIQQNVVRDNRRVAIIFEGRDAAGKGSVIKRFVEHMMPKYYRVVELRTPTKTESKKWLNRYKPHLPREQEMVFFDRSWYTRALTEPTMGYCTESQYKYFMEHVLKWEEKLISQGIELIKFYLSVNSATQLIRLRNRLKDPLKFWKVSPNDFNVRKRWKRFSMYKDQMFARTSSKSLPWVVVNSNSKRQAVLTCMLHMVNLYCEDFVPLTGETMATDYEMVLQGVRFKGLTPRQYAVLSGLPNSQMRTDAGS